MMLSLPQLLIASIIHEVGHAIIFAITKQKPRFKLHWWGIETTSPTLKYNTGYTLNLNAITGILAGYLYLFIVNATPYTSLTYFILCSMDIILMIQVWSVPHHIRKQNLIQISKYQLQQLEQS